jgi:hypothetical protein
MNVSVVVLNYNGLEHLETCLMSLLRQSYKASEIIVSDNGSTDGSVEYIKKNFPGVRILENGENLGFAKGNNLAIEMAIEGGAEYIALLNNDTEVHEGWIKEMVEVLARDEKIGACASKMLLFDRRDLLNSGGGAVNYVGHAWPEGLFEKDRGQYKKREIDLACAGAFMVKAKVLREVGLFDEDYFIYAEDTDLSWRIRLAGYRILFVPEAVVYHKYSPTFESKEKFYLLERNRLTTILKNYSVKSLVLLSPGILFAEGAALFYALMTGWFWKKLKGYWWNITNIARILEKRRHAQSLRRVSDSVIVADYRGTMEYAEISSSLVKKLFNPVFSFYWSLIKRFI